MGVKALEPAKRGGTLGKRFEEFGQAREVGGSSSAILFVRNVSSTMSFLLTLPPARGLPIGLGLSWG